MQERVIVEVNGAKLEIDLRTARRIETLQIGSRVKVLTKSAYSNECKVRPGVVTAFEPFENLPTIVVGVLEIDYSGAKLEFINYNAQSKDVEIVACVDDNALEVDRAEFHARIDKEIEQKQREIEDLKRRAAWFERNFKAYFAEPIAA